MFLKKMLDVLCFKATQLQVHSAVLAKKHRNLEKNQKKGLNYEVEWDIIFIGSITAYNYT
jgi:hypothetical protein